jgi:hypothetical protein
MALRAGATVGHFRIVNQLGAGGMGIVYLPRTCSLGVESL